MARLYNLARMTTATVGTGTITLGSASPSYLTFALAGVLNGDIVDYAILDGANSEIGTGTYTSAGTTLTRTITKSTNSNAAISLSGTAVVFIDARAETLNDASLFTTGTLPVARINGGTANQTVQGDGTFVTQGRKLLNTLTAASSSTLADTTSFTSTFSEYEIAFENIVPSIAAQPFQLQVHSAGVFQSASYVSMIQTSVGGAAWGGSTGTAMFFLMSASQTNAAPGVSGSIRVFTPSGTSAPKMWLGSFSGNSSTPAAILQLVNGYWNSNGAVDGFQVSFATGLLFTGTIKIYGLN